MGLDRRAWGLLLLVVVLGVAADQATKHFAELYLHGRGWVTVLDGFVELRYTRNPGAFFSLGASLSPAIRRVFFVLASGTASALILRLYWQTTPRQRMFRTALALLLAGALGNLVDRVVSGEVVDFIHMHWQDVLDWATFNVADILIVGGLGLLLSDIFVRRGELVEAPAAPRGTT